MPTPCYISIIGRKQGVITAGASTPDSVGDSFVEGHADEMLVQEFRHSICLPTNLRTGQPRGQRRHRLFSFAVSLNKSIPLLYNALVSGEKMNIVKLK